MCSKVRTPYMLQVYCTHFTCRAALCPLSFYRPAATPQAVQRKFSRQNTAHLSPFQYLPHSFPFQISSMRVSEIPCVTNTCRSDLNNAPLPTQDPNFSGFISRGGPCHSHLQIPKKALQFTFSQTQKLISIVAVTAIVKKVKLCINLEIKPTF